ncbi:MAG: hypothetical protein IT372_13295, partial [Polyangiaceae bacterium]|nr:hypothetical protein [Polyangiaceae bacterium]
TFGGYGTYKLGAALWDGYKEDGVLGALNTVNPLFHIGMGGLATYQAIENDDYRAAGAAGVKTAIVTIATVAGAAGGLKALGARAGAAGGVRAGEAGRFASLDARAVVGDALTPHHMPQAAMGFTSRAKGGALVMTAEEHAMPRTYGALGRATARSEAGMSFRDVLARDIRDVRRIVGSKYDSGLRDLLRYYREIFPDLMRR